MAIDPAEQGPRFEQKPVDPTVKAQFTTFAKEKRYTDPDSLRIHEGQLSIWFQEDIVTNQFQREYYIYIPSNLPEEKGQFLRTDRIQFTNTWKGFFQPFHIERLGEPTQRWGTKFRDQQYIHFGMEDKDSPTPYVSLKYGVLADNEEKFVRARYTTDGELEYFGIFNGDTNKMDFNTAFLDEATMQMFMQNGSYEMTIGNDRFVFTKGKGVAILEHFVDGVLKDEAQAELLLDYERALKKLEIDEVVSKDPLNAAPTVDDPWRNRDIMATLGLTWIRK